MTDRLLVLIPATGPALRWRRIDAGGALAGSGVLAGDTRIDLDDGTHVTAVVPGSAVSLHWVDMPKASAAQAAAAARHMAADFIAAPVADQHIAAAPTADADGMRIIGVADRRTVARWLSRLQHHGIDPDVIVPAPLLLPVVADSLTTLNEGDVQLVRGARLAVEAEPALAAILTEGRKAEAVRRDILDLAAATAPGALPLNLRQGEFARNRAIRIGARDIRRLALLAAACVAVFVVADAVRAMRYHFAANALETEIAAVARRVLPGDAPIADPLAALRTRLRTAGTGAGFTGISGALFSALRASSDIRLESLRYDAVSGVHATLVMPAGASLDGPRTRLAASGFNLVEGASRGAADGQRVDIEVSRT